MYGSRIADSIPSRASNPPYVSCGSQPHRYPQVTWDTAWLGGKTCLRNTPPLLHCRALPSEEGANTAEALTQFGKLA